MAQTNINIRIDEDLKREFEATCDFLGMNITTAMTVFAKKVSREKRIPFDIGYDPFYSESNMRAIDRAIDDIEAGRNISIHELIEVEDE
ncbi:MAG: type II toxin-antitoxin system RelB/DinJ family antitoxin [Oscillospiraceae bacterium]|jgi:DNA-damage-inducible protein J|nr:type II toxin-antitoxin system RelB/DinJ family antitoxin [Oscillospiraceae bacterium]